MRHLSVNFQRLFSPLNKKQTNWRLNIGPRYVLWTVSSRIIFKLAEYT